MATSKKRASAAKKPAAKRRITPSKRQLAGLTEKQRNGLRKLDAGYAEPIDYSVADILQESRDLQVAVRKLGAALYTKSNLKRDVGDSLADRHAMLDAAETEWAAHRIVVLPQQLRALRKEAEELKKEAIAALRHFKKGDPDVQSRLNAIVEGSGLADLIDDLVKLEALLREHKAALKNADLPKNTAARALELAEILGGEAAERAIDTEGSDALELRNRAYWWLRLAMNDVRDAGRYVYRKQPKYRAIFRASSTLARSGARAGRQTATKKPRADKAPKSDAVPQ